MKNVLSAIEKLFSKTIEEKFFENYEEEQRLMRMRSVYTAASRPTKPGVRG
jgi:hypothetical protein